MLLNSESWWSVFRTVLKIVGTIFLSRHGADPEVVDIVLGGSFLGAGVIGSHKAHKTGK